MKRYFLVILACLGSVAAVRGQTNQVPEYIPPVSLFESVEKVKTFLKSEAKADYSDKYLASVSLSAIPKKGPCWVYSFAFKKWRMGGEAVIYHFMDGRIEEGNVGF